MGTATTTYEENFQAGVFSVPVVGAGFDEGAMSVATAIDGFEAAMGPGEEFATEAADFVTGLGDALSAQGDTQGTLISTKIAEYAAMIPTEGGGMMTPEEGFALFADPATSVGTALGSALGEGGENGAGAVSDVVLNLAEAGANVFGSDTTPVAIYGRDFANNVEITANAVVRVATALEDAVAGPLTSGESPEFDPATYSAMIETELTDIIQNSVEGNLLGTDEGTDSAAKNVRDIADGVSDNLLAAGETVGTAMARGGDIVYTAAVNQGSIAAARVIESMGTTGQLIADSVRGDGAGYNGELADAVEMITEQVQSGSADLEAAILGGMAPLNDGASDLAAAIVENAQGFRTQMQELRAEVNTQANAFDAALADGASGGGMGGDASALPVDPATLPEMLMGLGDGGMGGDASALPVDPATLPEMLMGLGDGGMGGEAPALPVDPATLPEMLMGLGDGGMGGEAPALPVDPATLPETVMEPGNGGLPTQDLTALTDMLMTTEPSLPISNLVSITVGGVGDGLQVLV